MIIIFVLLLGLQKAGCGRISKQIMQVSISKTVLAALDGYRWESL